jgi:hypothetical protein
MSEKEEEPTDAPEPVNIKVNFRVPGRMPSVYAHHMLIQTGEQEMTLSFFEVIPPLISTDREENVKLLQEAGITAECVARITIAKRRFTAFASAMQQVAGQISSEQRGEEADADNSGDDQQG